MSEAIITTDKYGAVRHTQHDHQYGFDLTDFGDSDTFHAFMDGLGLEGSDYRGLVDGVYVWVNGEGLFVSNNNPTSGKHANEERPPEEGFASYIGIEGTEEFVAKARLGVEYYADYIKGHSDRRDYL